MWFGASRKARSFMRRLEPWIRMIWWGLSFSVIPRSSSCVQCAAKLTRSTLHFSSSPAARWVPYAEAALEGRMTAFFALFSSRLR